MTKKQKEKLKEIKSNPGFLCRCSMGIVNALENGVSINNADDLFLYVKDAYETIEGKKRSPGYIKKTFKSSYVYFNQQLGNL